MSKIPKKLAEPFTINGIRFANRQEYDERIKDDALKLAKLLYDIYREKGHQQKPQKQEEVI